MKSIEEQLKGNENERRNKNLFLANSYHKGYIRKDDILCG